MKKLLLLICAVMVTKTSIFATSQVIYNDTGKLENPISVDYLKKNLRKEHPRLVLTPPLEKQLKEKVKNDPLVKNMYQAIKGNVAQIMNQPLLERIVEGRRLLAVSREMLYRINMLGMTYRIEKGKDVLDRINQEVLAVCNFSDWNPSHYLDVAEMSMAVAFALDWAGEDLPKTTVQLAQNALIEKGILPSYNEKGNTGWINGTNNWNQVCHGGMIAASIAIAEKDPELAAKTIHRALEGMPHALDEYGPDGVYPEGATYWIYGTSFSVVTAAMFESAFGQDFGLSTYPAFIESATYKVLNTAPSGFYYNFADCGDKRSENGDAILAWFATKTGNSAFFEADRFMQSPDNMSRLSRLDGAALVWISQFKASSDAKIPLAWKGDGPNPIVIFKGGHDDPHQYYFGGKGGRGTVNHGNMDGGSFIFELNGVRWVIDPGNQNYHDLEKTGFNLWERCQTCERWTLLTKNNFGHSTITVNDALHVVDGMASIIDFKDGEKPEATIDLTPTFEGQLKSITRTFVKSGPQSLKIIDQLETIPETKFVNWQLMTTAEVEIVSNGVILRQDGKMLKVKNLSDLEVPFSVISLYPAPLELDRQIKNLKRLELRIPAYLLSGSKKTITIELTGE